MTIKEQVRADIWKWITNYIEVDNKFYDYEFPPCPYARGARLKGIVTVNAYESGDVKKFVSEQAHALVVDPKFEIAVLAMPPRKQWTYGFNKFIEELNAELIPNDYYAQYGFAVKSTSAYPGLFNKGRYFIIIINKLGPVLDGHKALLKTSYYTPWSKKHYDDVVTRRNQMVEKYGKNK